MNSVVLLKNISNEAKREPLRLARIEEIKKSRDGTQRVVVVTHQNVSLNKKGEWVGNPITVERCVSDVILVDNALSESMLSPKLKAQNNEDSSDNQENMEIRGEIADRIKDENITGEEKVVTDDVQDEKVATDDIQDEKVKTESKKDEQVTNVIKSQRIQKQRMVIDPDQIGDCDDKQDLDYK